MAFRRKSVPVSVSICKGIFDSLGHLDSELESALSVSCLTLGMVVSSRRSASLIHHANAGSSTNLVGDGILGDLYGIRFLQISEWFLCRGTLFPSHQELSSFGRASPRPVRSLFSTYLSSFVTAEASLL
jgi:hypothetical protein